MYHTLILNAVGLNLMLCFRTETVILNKRCLYGSARISDVLQAICDINKKTLLWIDGSGQFELLIGESLAGSKRKNICAALRNLWLLLFG